MYYLFYKKCVGEELYYFYKCFLVRYACSAAFEFGQNEVFFNVRSASQYCVGQKLAIGFGKELLYCIQSWCKHGRYFICILLVSTAVASPIEFAGSVK